MTIAGTDTDHHKPGRWQRRAFANAVESAFSLSKLESVARQVRAGGTFEFALPADESMVFEKDSILYRTRRGTDVTLSRDDLACVAIANRAIKLREFGSREGWFTSSGVHSIQLERMTNVRLFLLLIHELYDVPVTGS